MRIICPQELCALWCLNDPGDSYALEFSEPAEPAYITEKNRGNIQNGYFLKLTASPARRTQRILDTLAASGNHCPVEVNYNTILQSYWLIFSTNMNYTSTKRIVIAGS